VIFTSWFFALCYVFLIALARESSEAKLKQSLSDKAG